MNKLKYILRHRFVFKILALTLLILVIVLTQMFYKKSVYKGNETEFIGIVYKLKKYQDKTVIYLKTNEKIIANYTKEEALDVSVGDKVKIYGTLKEPSNNTIPNIFNYKKYLYYNDIYYLIDSKEVIKLSNNKNILYYIRKKLNGRIDKIYKSSSYIKVFVLGDNSSLDEESLSSYRENGISHLLSISGMHVTLFAGLIMFFMKKVSYNNYYNYLITLLFIVMYCLLIGSSPSIIRTIIMYILFSLNKLFNLKIKSIDIMCMVLIIILIIKPYYIYNISFQYSYLISFFLILFNYKLNKKSYFMKSLNISLISFLVSFPICIYNFYQVNFLSIILNIFFVPLVSFIIFPLAMISLFIPAISKILNIFIIIFENISLFISNNNIGIIVFSKPKFIIIIVYYILIILFLYKHKYLFIFFMMLIQKISIYVNPSFELTMLDVGQGDSIFIKYPYNKGNILVDTGGTFSHDYSIAERKIIPYLKSIGLSKIDYLILTHGDNDHIGETIELVNNFTVKKIIFNQNEYNDLEMNIINNIDISYQKNIFAMNINNNAVYFLNDIILKDENRSSIVMYLKYRNYKFLLTGDIPIEIEEKLILKYNLQNIDFLKIAHHGSNTSTSDNFLKTTNPKYCLISVGKNNIYHHPNKDVISRLNKCQIYRTDIDGSTKIIISKKNVKFLTYKA